MKLHEYQAKDLLASHGIRVPAYKVADCIEDAINYAEQLMNQSVVIKAQVHAGGRGKAGGIAICKNLDEVSEFASSKLKSRLVTAQTDSEGQPINFLLIESAIQIKRELYLGIAIDPETKRIVIMASNEGGVDIELVARKNPEKIYKTMIDPLTGFLPWQGRQIAYKLEFDRQQIKDFTDIVHKMVNLFTKNDLSILEVNPLIVTDKNEIICLDCKIAIDNNSLYRQKHLHSIYDKTQENAKELQAQEYNLNYVSLDGEIGCMVNGAGLAMATMDIIKHYGSKPANFLDIGGSATAERVSQAMQLILSDKQVKGVLINIFGGIVRCNLIAIGIIAALKQMAYSVPIMVRLEGTNSTLGRQMILDSGQSIYAETDLATATKKIIDLANHK